MKTEPNKAMERSRILVTVRAYARPAPSIRLAHLRRSVLRKTAMTDKTEPIRLDDASIVKLAFVLLEGQKLVTEHGEHGEHGGPLVRKLTELVDRINGMQHFPKAN